MEIDHSIEKGELAKLGLLEAFLKRKTLFNLISSARIESSIREKVTQEFMSANGLNSNEEFEQYFAKLCILPADIDYIVLKDELIKQYIVNEIGEASIKARFLADAQKLTMVDFEVLSFKEESAARYAFVRYEEDKNTFKEIESFMPGKCKLFSYNSQSLSSISAPLRNLIRGTEIGKARAPFLFNSAWRIVIVNELKKPELDQKTKLAIGKALLEEKVELIYKKSIMS